MSEHRFLSFTKVAWPRALLVFGAALALSVLAAEAACAQSYNVIYNFTGTDDGTETYYALTVDPRGTLYGAAPQAGNYGGVCDPSGCGTIFRLTNNGTGWTFTLLYAFTGTSDGATPISSLTPGPGGAFYGTTLNGGIDGNHGTVFSVRPTPTICSDPPCAWVHNVLHDFNGEDGSWPVGDVIFDGAGNLYGTTEAGAFSSGQAYLLTPAAVQWQLNILYQFATFGHQTDGRAPQGVIMDAHGNLFGVTMGGGSYGFGTVFELSPSDSGWQEQILYEFTNGDDGRYPVGGLIFDRSGNLIGSTIAGARYGGGTAFELTPSDGGWQYATIYTFNGHGGPHDRFVIDDAGNLYGTTYQGGSHFLGSVFRLSQSPAGWTYTSLHDFAGGTDGNQPIAGVSFDSHGNLFGTAQGGTYDYGTVYEITP
jgi:uncharacterized repeat protein (TIGR03803 family)